MKQFALMIVALIVVTIVSPVVFAFQVGRKLFRKDSLKEYFYQVAIGLDQVGGSVLYGTEDWTVSSYTYILEQKGNREAHYFRRFIDFLFGDEHCKKSYEVESRQQNTALCKE